VVWQQTRLRGVAREDKAELLWGPHGTLPLGLKIASVATIHDLTSLTMPLKHRMKTLASFNLLIARSIHAASHLACVSKATADEVMRGFDVEASRITIVPNGVDPFFAPGEDRELPFGLEHGDYILYVGTLEPRKGLDELITAWEGMRPALRLVLCGGYGWGTTSLLRRIEHHPRRPEIIVSGYLDRTMLRALYRHAALFAYPSHYEGFGLPPLEAMACGTPVVTTRAGAIPEVVGDAALLVPRSDAAALRSAMEKIRQEESLRGSLRERGLARARQFTWKASAAAMMDAIGKALR
jgi:glycosyltransferase involved in cell wall biosynthesis